MNRKRFFALSVFAATVGVVATASVAWADPTSSHSGGANAVQTGVVRIDPNDPTTAYVTGNYNCPAAYATTAHLFVSVKQVADGRPDSRLKLPGSSQYASAWLENHPGTDTFTCDGTWHTGTWRISSTFGPYSDYGAGGSLIPGQVYVQFCWDSPDGTWHAYSEQFAHAGY